LENKILLPRRIIANPNPPCTSNTRPRPQPASNTRSGCRTNGQAPRSAGDGFDDEFGDFEEVKKKKPQKQGKGNNGGRNQNQNNGTSKNEQNGNKNEEPEEVPTKMYIFEYLQKNI
jgi:hypothetical protein